LADGNDLARRVRRFHHLDLNLIKDILLRLSNALNLLSPEQRIIFDLRHLQHQAVKEISDRLPCSQSTAKKQLQRAVLKLRNQVVGNNQTMSLNLLFHDIFLRLK
jgi:DNA-directed RNA polymerase specialized sigma24 family protein